MLDRFSLVRWRSVTDPPKHGARVLVDRPILAHAPVFAYLSAVDDMYKMWSDPHDTLDPRPSVWCDPSPPGGDPLTIEDLDILGTMPGGMGLTHEGGVLVAFDQERWEAWHRAAARLRRAIEEAER